MNNVTSTDQSVKPEIPENGVQDDKEKDMEDLRYGFGNIRPAWMQVFNRPKVVLSILCYTAFVQGFIINGVINANMTTIEKRFEFPSQMSGWIASIYDLTAAPVALFVCFRGAVNYKLRWLGGSFIVFSLGSFIMSLPHFFTPSYEWDKHMFIHCANETTDQCAAVKNESPNIKYLGVFLLGQICHSVGGSILYSLGMTILDDIVKPMTTPLYIGIMMFFSTLGPALGYIAGSQFLNVFVEPQRGNEISFDSSDPRWVGAWWICFFLSGSLSIFIGPILLGYRRELPVTKSIQMNRESQTHQRGKQISDIHTTVSLTPKLILLIVWSLFKNPVFVFVLLAASFEGIILSGLSTYFPKFLENQFDESASFASLISGIIAIPAAAGGEFIGGYLCKRFSLRVSGQCLLSIASLSIGLLTYGIFWAKCEVNPFAGITENYSELSILNQSMTEQFTSILDSKCNSKCSCTTNIYHPVCGSNDVEYFSPCYAGCATYNITNKTHMNCSCLTGSNITDTARDGRCPPRRCNYFNVTVSIMFLSIFFTFVAQTPIVSIILRCTPDNHRSFAIGIAAFIGRLIGTLPGPLLFGFGIDKACKVWKSLCSETGTFCWIYEKELLASVFFTIVVVVRSVSILFLVIAKCVYSPPEPVDKTNTKDRINDNTIEENYATQSRDSG